MFVLFIGVAAAGMATAHVSNAADDSAHVHAMVNSITKETLANDRDQGDPHPIDWLAVEVSDVSPTRAITCIRWHLLVSRDVVVWRRAMILTCSFAALCHRDVTCHNRALLPIARLQFK